MNLWLKQHTNLLTQQFLSEADEVTLARALASGSDVATRLVIERFSPVIQKIASSSLPPADAEDLEQDVLLRLFERLPRVRDLTALRTYVVSTTLFSLRRRLRHQRVLDLATSGCLRALASNRSIAPHEEARRVLASLARIVDGMTGRDRTLFILRVVDRRSLPEVARKVGSSLSTVKRRMHRLRRRVTVLASRDLYLSGYGFPGDGAQPAPARRK